MYIVQVLCQPISLYLLYFDTWGYSAAVCPALWVSRLNFANQLIIFPLKELIGNLARGIGPSNVDNDWVECHKVVDFDILE